MKTKIPMISLAVLLATGCATNDIVPAGPGGAFLITRGGWPQMSGLAAEAACFRDANHFCTNQGLVMIPVSTNLIDGQVFAHSASCSLTFKAVKP